VDSSRRNCAYVDLDTVEEIVGRKDEACRCGLRSGVGHDLRRDVLLDVERAGVQEVPDAAAVVQAAARAGDGDLEELAEHERDELEEERGYADDLRPELEEHAEDGAEDGEAEPDEPRPERVDWQRGVVIERAERDGEVLGGLCAAAVVSDR
jgi:hypothetical protein